MTIRSARKASRITTLLATSTIAAGLMTLAGPALANSWDNLTGTGFTTSLPDAHTTNIDLNAQIGRGYGDLDIYTLDTVNVNMNGIGHTFVGTDITNDPTQILGRLNSDGRVILINTNGVFFGQGSQVDVGSLIVSTGAINEIDLLRNEGKLTFSDFGTGSIVNNGLISVADAGLAAFVSPTVVNNGIINAKLGTVAFAAGSKVTLDLYGDQLVEIAVNDKAADALLENNGAINAEGGNVIMTAQAAKSAVDNVINMSGVVNVASVSQVGGKIILSGGEQGVVKVTGKLDASGEQAGGTAEVTGENVWVTETSLVLASAMRTGNGGNVRYIAQNGLVYNGLTVARGGAEGGNGGFVDTSGHGYIEILGTVDASAYNGLGGKWLIDPRSIEVVENFGGTHHSTSGTNPVVFSATQNNTSRIQASTIEDSLNTGTSVTLRTMSGGNGEGDITVNADINVAMGPATDKDATLRLESHDDIIINNKIESTDGKLHVELLAGLFTGSGDNDIIVNAPVITNGGDFTGTAADDVLVFADITTGAGNVTLTATDGYILVGGTGGKGVGGTPAIPGTSGTPATPEYWTKGSTTVTTDPTTGWTQYSGYWQKGSGNSRQYTTEHPSGQANGWTQVNAPIWYNGTDYSLTNPTTGWTYHPAVAATPGTPTIPATPGGKGATGTDVSIVTSTGDITLTARTSIQIGGNGGESNGKHAGGNGGDAELKSTTASGDITLNAGTTVRIGGVASTGDGGAGSITATGGKIDINNSGKFFSTAENTLNNSNGGLIELNQKAGGSIQNAINAINNSGTGSNTILVGAGNYTENLLIDHDNLKLIGTSGATVKAATAGNLVTVTADNVLIDPITFDGLNVASNGIYAAGVEGLVVDGNIFRNFLQDGIHVEDSDSIILKSNTISNIGANGIFVGNSIDAAIGGDDSADGNEITGAGAHGIYVSGGESALVQNNKIKGGNPGIQYFWVLPIGATNGVAGAQLDGIHVENNDGVEILDNKIMSGQTGVVSALFGAQGGDGANRHGIYVSGSNKATIDRNLLLGDALGGGLAAGENGIHVENSNALTIGGLIPLANGNKVLSAGGDGIHVDGSKGTFILNNIVGGLPTDSVGGDGIDLQNTKGAVVGGNIITDVNGDGIEISDSLLSLISLNMITNAGDNGIRLFDAGLGIVGWNTVDGSGADGVNVRKGAFLLVTDNTVTDSGDDGIDAVGLLATSVRDNTVDGADGHGIRVGLGALVGVSGNTVNHTGGDGVHAGYVFGLDVDGNEVTFTDGDGIHVHHSLRADVTDNRVSFTGDDGIDVENSDGVDIEGNKVRRTRNNGIEVSDSDYADINGNSVKRAGDNGIDVEGSDDVELNGNNVRRSRDNGIALRNGRNALLAGNTVTRNRDDGLNVENYSGELTIHGENVFSNNGDDGIDIEYTNGTILIDGNTIEGNDDDGIDVTYGYKGPQNEQSYRILSFEGPSESEYDIDSLIISNNVIDGNGDNGIEVDGAPDTAVISNLISGNGSRGLFMQGPANGSVVLSGNHFIDNPVGAEFESGTIDLTGEGNRFVGGEVALRFSPFASTYYDWIWNGESEGEGEGGWSMVEVTTYAPMNLVDNTIGSQYFEGQTRYFVELDNGAFYNPGTPTLLNALNSTFVTPFGTLRPFDTDGALSQEQFDYLEQMFFHHTDRADLGLFFFGFVPDDTANIDQERIFNRFTAFNGRPGQFSITLTGLPSTGGQPQGGTQGGGGGLANFLNSITPAAGGQGGQGRGNTGPSLARILAALEPAAGGNDGNGGQQQQDGVNMQEASCWADAIAAAGSGVITTVNYNASPEAAFGSAANCGSGGTF